jgi:hypothetical protein
MDFSLQKKTPKQERRQSELHTIQNRSSQTALKLRMVRVVPLDITAAALTLLAEVNADPGCGSSNKQIWGKNDYSKARS